MQYFLKESAQFFLSEFGTETADIAVIFPGKRSILYFNKYLSELSDKPIWAPAYYTISGFMEKLSGLKVTEKLTLIFELFEVYKKITGSNEKIDAFFYYAEMLLSDFDDIDKYLVNPKDIFQNLADLKHLENHFDYLEEEQVKVIRRFWESFRNGTESQEKKSFISLWEVMPEIYDEFKTRLTAKGIAYEGMIYRKIAGQIAANEFQLPDFRKIMFVGFNALNKSEDRLFTHLKKIEKALFLWDFDTYYTNNNIHEAGFFIRENLKKYPPPDLNCTYENLTKKDKKITVVNIASNTGQTSAIPLFLNEPGNSAKHISFDDSAVILADEALLLPVLASVPENIEDINVTMGFPFIHSSLYNLIYCIINLHKNKRENKATEISFYHKDVIALLNAPEVFKNTKSNIEELKRFIVQSNRIYLTPIDIAVNDLLKLIVKLPDDSRQLPDYFLSVFSELNKSLQERDGDKNSQSYDSEFLYLAIITFKRLKELLDVTETELSDSVVFSLILRSLSGVTIPFSGEPLKGLQVMGILETRVLDFENIIILSMNEGIFPNTGNLPTFIPLSLRYGFGLPTPEHRDAIYAYYFYRLIQRAKNITLVFNSRHDGLSTGERSRFIHQLFYDPVFTLDEKNISAEVTFKLPKKISIRKDSGILRFLEKYSDEDSKNYLTPSAINTYLSCSLKFYFRYISGLKETDQVTEELDQALFGSVLHKTMELLYRPFIGKLITSEQIHKIILNQENVGNSLNQAFRDEYSNGRSVEIQGQNIILQEILKSYLNRILEVDKKYAPFNILGLERKYIVRISSTNNTDLKIGGIIDRIDEKEGKTRIVDYKSGEVKNTFESIDALFDNPGSKRNNAVFQTLLYSLILKIAEKRNHIIPGLYFIRNIFKNNFDYRILLKDRQLPDVVVEDADIYLELFEKRLTQVLSEIINPEVSFVQTDDLDVCKYCPYISICHRG